MQTTEAPRRIRRSWLLVPTIFLALTGVALAGGGQGGSVPTAGVVYAGATHIDGKDIYVAGDFEDDVLGRGAIIYVTRATATDADTILVKARRITIYTRKGSMTGKGRATQTFHEDGTSTISDGKFKLKKGTGKYRGDRFKGTFDGSFEEGVYTFDYVGELK